MANQTSRLVERIEARVKREDSGNTSRAHISCGSDRSTEEWLMA